ILDALPPPTGSSRIPAALAEAAQGLTFADNATRHVIVLTDGQALPWSGEAAADWTRLAELRGTAAIVSQMFAVDVAGRAHPSRPNASVDPLSLSRARTVPGFPLRIRTSLHNWGDEPAQKRVWLELNGQQLQEQSRTVSIPARGQTPIEFEQRFASNGSYAVAVAIEPDDLPGDDRSAA